MLQHEESLEEVLLSPWPRMLGERDDSLLADPRERETKASHPALHQATDYVIINYSFYYFGPMVPKFCSGLLSAHKICCDLVLEHAQKLVAGETGAPEVPDPTWCCFLVCVALPEGEQSTKLDLDAVCL